MRYLGRYIGLTGSMFVPAEPCACSQRDGLLTCPLAISIDNLLVQLLLALAGPKWRDPVVRMKDAFSDRSQASPISLFLSQVLIATATHQFILVQCAWSPLSGARMSSARECKSFAIA